MFINLAACKHVSRAHVIRGQAQQLNAKQALQWMPGALSGLCQKKGFSCDCAELRVEGSDTPVAEIWGFRLADHRHDV